jgi:DNA-binding MarR family transcriptional regulator
MSPSLRDELRQRKAFTSLEEECFLNIVRTEAVLRASLARLLKASGVTPAQYNVLRILRGAGVEGLCRNAIGARLVTRMPDVTRLLDRMEEGGLIVRGRSTEDRRHVDTRLTAKGRKLVDSLDAPVDAEHRRSLGHLSASQLRELIELLTLARERG